MRGIRIIPWVALVGCAPALPGLPDAVPFEAVDGWVVETSVSPLQCPDGQDAVVVRVRPSSNDFSASALILHSGAVDFVKEPLEADPTFGDHAAVEDRLSRDWSVRRIFSTLGISPETDTTEVHRGTLIAALAEAGVVSVLPGNCWGDRWHNDADQPNDAVADAFERKGREAALNAWDLLSDEQYLPPSETRYVIGLGDGGNGAAELLHVGIEAAGVLVDSSPDDLHSYTQEPDLYADILEGLARTHPDNAYASGSLVDTSVPTVYAYAQYDGSLPIGIHSAALAELDAAGNTLVGVDSAEHVVSNADPELATSLVEALLSSPVP